MIEIKCDQPLHLGATLLKLSKLHMYDSSYNVLKPSLNYLQLHYIDTYSFIVTFTEGNIPDEYMDLSNLDIPIKSNNEVTGKFKYEFGSKIIDEFLILSSKHIGWHAASTTLFQKRKE